MESSRASSPRLSRSAAAATLASRWAGSPVPGMASTCGPRCSVQASRTWAAEAPCAPPTASTSSGSAPVAPAPRPGPGDCEVRHEGDALLPAGVHEPVLLRARAEPHPVDAQVTELPGARGRRGHRPRSHGRPPPGDAPADMDVPEVTRARPPGAGRPGLGQPARVAERAAQQELDLGIGAAQLVAGPPGQRVVHSRVEPQQNALTSPPLPDPHW